MLGKGVAICPGGWVINRCSGMVRSCFAVLGESGDGKIVPGTYLRGTAGPKASQYPSEPMWGVWRSQKPRHTAPTAKLMACELNPALGGGK